MSTSTTRVPVGVVAGALADPPVPVPVPLWSWRVPKLAIGIAATELIV